MDSKMDKMPLMEKYRPETIDSIHEHDFVKKILKRFLMTGDMPHLLFNGPAGTGKTSAIMALGNELFGEYRSQMMLELNGSDDRGISVIREKIKHFAVTRNLLRPDYPKIIVLDEADSMTYDAQFALRRIIELHTKNVRFCFLCNWENKIIDAIKSRCLVYRFNRLSTNTIENQMSIVMQNEKILSKGKIAKISQVIGKNVSGDMRKAYNILEQIRYISSKPIPVITDHIFYIVYGVEKSSFGLFEKKLTSIIHEKSDRCNAHLSIYELVKTFMVEHSITFSTMIKLITFNCKEQKKYFILKEMAPVVYRYNKISYDMEQVYILSLCDLLAKYYIL